MEDAEGVLKLFRPCHYGTTVDVADGIRIRFIDAGHLLGSASIEIWLNENGVQKKLLFFGRHRQPQPAADQKTPTYPETADYVIMESTYGDRSPRAQT